MKAIDLFTISLITMVSDTFKGYEVAAYNDDRYAQGYYESRAEAILDTLDTICDDDRESIKKLMRECTGVDILPYDFQRRI